MKNFKALALTVTLAAGTIFGAVAPAKAEASCYLGDGFRIYGERKKGWFVGGLNVTTLPEMMNALGGEGWELVSHVVNQDNQTNNVTLHYMSFKRQNRVNVTNRFYSGLGESADGGRGTRSSLPLIG